MMKKFLMVAIVALGLLSLVSGKAMAFTLDWGGEVQFHFVDWDMGTLWAQAPTGGGLVATNWKTGSPTLGDGKEDSWGVASISSVTKPPSHDPANPADVLWSSIGSGETLEAHFYGLDDMIVGLNSTSTIDYLSVTSGEVANGAFIELYLDDVYGIPTTPYVGGTYPADAGKIIDGAAHNVSTITDGEMILRLKFLPYYGQGLVYDTDYAFNKVDGKFVYGSGAAYLEVVGGTWADTFNQDYFNDMYEGADVYFTAQYDVNAPKSNWLVKTSGVATTATPEPASMILMGLGLLGATRLRRRKV